MTGAFTGLGVALFDRVTRAVVFQAVLRAPRWVQVGAPLVGLAADALALRFIAGDATPSIADDYVKAMTSRQGTFALRPLAGRMIAAVATLGTGGAMGYEGPPLYLGAGIGVAFRQRCRRLFSGVDPHVALVAGVAAIFKAPATGAVFALGLPPSDRPTSTVWPGRWGAGQ